MSAKIKILTVIYIFILAGIVILADVYGTSSFAFIRVVPHADKIGHFCLAGTFSLLVNLALRARTFGVGKLKYLLGSLIVSVIVLTEEFSQKFVGNRTFDAMDLLADFAGIIVFGEVVRLICRRIPGRGTGDEKIGKRFEQFVL